MRIKIISIAFLLIFTGIYGASAQTSCDSVDDIWQTFSVIRDIEVDEKRHRYTENIEDLGTLTNHIFLPVLISSEFKRSFPQANENLFSYVARIRQAVAGANAGHHSFTLQTLSGLTSGSFAESILALQNYLGCAFGQSTEETNPFLAKNSIIQGSQLAENDGVNYDQLASHSFKAPDFEKNVVSQQGAAGSNILDDPALVLKLLVFTIFTIIVVVLTVRLLVKRRLQYIQRQERHVCNKFAQLNMGGKLYAARILDITMNGMKIQHFGTLKRKRTLRVRIDGKQYRIQVKWLNSSFSGVQFKRPISAETLQLLLRTTSSQDLILADEMQKAS